MDVKFRVAGKIKKPVNEVFDAVYNPDKLKQYFNDAASGPLKSGGTVSWHFEDFDVDLDVHIKETVPNERIVFEWPARQEGLNTEVIFTFTAIDANSTLVEIRESGWPADDAGLQASYDNCQGWTHMLCSLKSWLENGVALKRFFNEPC